MAQELSAEDRAWLNEPVDVQVQPDEQRWLDTMLEMGKEDFIKYAVYNYGLEESAARASTRNGLVQLVVLANRSGGGGSVLKVRYRYLNKLKGILQPMVAVRRGGRLLYLTRGQDKQMQVLDKTTGEWLSYEAIVPKTPAVQRIANEVSNGPTGPSGVSVVTLLPLLPKMNREQLEKVASDLGMPEPTSMEKYPSNKVFVDEIVKFSGVKPEEQ